MNQITNTPTATAHLCICTGNKPMSENTKKEEYWICKDLACNHKIAGVGEGAVTFAEGFVMFESMQAVGDRRYNLIPKHLSQACRS